MMLSHDEFCYKKKKDHDGQVQLGRYSVRAAGYNAIRT